MTLNPAIQLYDSELGAIVREEDRVDVRLLPAYVHRSAGEPGVADGIGGWQPCASTFEVATINGVVGELPTDIMSGALVVEGRSRSTMIPLPAEIKGVAVMLVLHLDPDYREVIVSGSGFRVVPTGEFEPVEEFRA